MNDTYLKGKKKKKPPETYLSWASLSQATLHVYICTYICNFSGAPGRPDLGRAFIHYLIKERALTQTRAGKGGAGGTSKQEQKSLGKREHFYKQTLKIKTWTKSNKQLLSTSFFFFSFSWSFWQTQFSSCIISSHFFLEQCQCSEYRNTSPFVSLKVAPSSGYKQRRERPSPAPTSFSATVISDPATLSTLGTLPLTREGFPWFH